MKQFLIFLLIHTTTCFAGVKESDIPYYEIKSVKKDPNMPRSTARIAFQFEEHSGACLKNKVDYKINDVMATHPILDTNGRYSRNISPGTYEFEFQSPECDPIKTKKIDIKVQTIVTIFVHFHSNVNIIEADKPVIYLYPENETNVFVKLDFKGTIDFSYPAYTNGWEVTAFPDGTLKSGNNSYGYLFYEGKIDDRDIKTNYKEGSVVKSSEVTSFLETSLTAMGLNSKEIADFVTYWAPRMMQNEKNYIRFLLTDEYDKIASIVVNPKPDNMLRVYMVWMNATHGNYSDLVKQTFTPIKRNKFTLVEWGGSELQNLAEPLIDPK
jgi:hypothetical protein